MLRLTTAAIVAVFTSGVAQAAVIMDGTAGIGFTTGFTVNTAATPGVFSATNAIVTVANTTGGLSTPNAPGFPFSFGTFNGSFTFSKVANGSITQTVPSLLTFGAFTFTAESVSTISYISNPGVSTSGALYLLGYTSASGSDDTPTSLTLSFNNTGNSAFSASATVAIPPTGVVPEPASWGLMVLGFGAIGAAMRSRRKTVISFG